MRFYKQISDDAQWITDSNQMKSENNLLLLPESTCATHSNLKVRFEVPNRGIVKDI